MMHKNVRKRLFEFTILTHSQKKVFDIERNCYTDAARTI